MTTWGPGTPGDQPPEVLQSASPPGTPVGPGQAAHAGISVRGITRTFGSVRAVADMSFDALPGRVTALVGPNGAGKTTLLLILATLLKPESGWVRIGGYDPVTEPRRVRSRMGWAPDVMGYYDVLSIGTYLEVMASAYGLSGATRQAAVQRALHTAKLADRAQVPVHTLSRGQKQRLGLARALIHDPAVLLLDEPASGLDPRSRLELTALLRDLAAHGRAVLVSSHALDDLEDLADDVVFVDGGRTVASHRVDALPTGTALRRYRVRSSQPETLAAVLGRLGVASHRSGRTAFDLDVLGGEDSAAGLLRELVRADVPVNAFGPVGGELETAYLQLTEGGPR